LKSGHACGCEAEASLRRSLELDPDTSSTHFDLGVVLFRMGNVPGAEQNVRRALRMPQPPPGARLRIARNCHLEFPSVSRVLAGFHQLAGSCKVLLCFFRNLVPELRGRNGFSSRPFPLRPHQLGFESRLIFVSDRPTVRRKRCVTVPVWRHHRAHFARCYFPSRSFTTTNSARSQ